MKSTSYIILIALLVSGVSLKAQLPEDALRMSWNVPSGTARSQAIGGAAGSLGGEITSLFVNPAGLGFYKTSELVFTPGFSMAKSNSNYRETSATSDNQTRFNLGTTGFVGGHSQGGSKWTSKAFAIGVNRVANFNSTVYYKGRNNLSSYSEQFAEEFANSGVDLNNFENSDLSYGTKLALFTYLIDTATINGQKQVVGLPEFVDEVNQENKITTRGGITEIAIGFASNMDDRLYIGGSIGLPIVNYVRSSEFTETDASNDQNNYFNSSQYKEEFSSKGVGVNAKLGLIFKPVQSWRVGLAIHTPSLYGMREKYSANMTTDVGAYPNAPGGPVFSGSSESPAAYRYDLISPWKFLVSGTYIFSEVADVKQQRGFLTGDIEYVTHGSSRLSSADENGIDDTQFFKDLNSVVKSQYKGAVNFRVGGELKFNTLMTRLGFAYYGNPYEDKEIKGNKMNLSGGLGYRNKGVFVDVTYVQSLNNDVNFPYRLADKANTFADIKDRSGAVILTVGFKL